MLANKAQYCWQTGHRIIEFIRWLQFDAISILFHHSFLSLNYRLQEHFNLVLNLKAVADKLSAIALERSVG